MIYKQTAGRFDLLGEIPAGGYTDGRNPRLFRNSAYQTHGLVIEGSRRYGYQQVDFVLLQLGDERRRGLLQDLAAIVDPTHEAAPETPCDTAQLSSRDHFAQTIDGELAVHILIGVAVIIICVVYLKICGTDITGNLVQSMIVS